MAKLTDEEQEALDKLLAKQKAPDEPARNGGPTLNFTIDLADPDSVRRGLRLGLFDRGDLDEFEEQAAADDGDDDPEPDPEPRRRLTRADRMMGATE